MPYLPRTCGTCAHGLRSDEDTSPQRRETSPLYFWCCCAVCFHQHYHNDLVGANLVVSHPPDSPEANALSTQYYRKFSAGDECACGHWTPSLKRLSKLA